MTTLAANNPRAFEVGQRGEYAVIASDIIFEGAAVGIVEATGHARPLAAGDRFGGFAEAKADNSAGAAAAINVRTIKSGAVSLSVSGAVITDVGQPVYATDDNAFQFTPTSAVFIGYLSRFVSAGVGIVEFNTGWQDPYGGGIYETKSTNYTVDAQDCGKTLFVDTDAVVISMPATATAANVTVVNIAAFGAALVSVSPVTADQIIAPDISGTANKDLQNTKATAQRGDLVHLVNGHADGPTVQRLVGTWAEEA